MHIIRFILDLTRKKNPIQNIISLEGLFSGFSKLNQISSVSLQKQLKATLLTGVNSFWQTYIIGDLFLSTYRENVAMFQLHSIQELGNVFSKFERMAQPWNHPFVKRRLSSGSTY